jgi:hypothetical protein
MKARRRPAGVRRVDVPYVVSALAAALALGMLTGVGTLASSAAAPNSVPYAATDGYWLMAADGGIFSYGGAGFHGSTGALKLNAPVVGGARTPSSNGYWEVAADGGVFAFGDANFYGSMGGQHLNAPVVGMAATPDGQGYWLVAADGGIFSFGDAYFYGSMGGQHLNAPVVGMAGTQLGNGYWLAAADGGVFAFGAAAYLGSMGGKVLDAPVVGVSVTSSFAGYTLVAADGGVFTFGDAPFNGSGATLRLNAPVVSMSQIGPTVGGRVLLVGTFEGIPGQYASVQSAVDAARPGDWILVAPGDYHEANDMTNPPTPGEASAGWFGGVEIDTPYIHLRGMNRNSTIIDGTLPGSTPCSGSAADQNFGATIAGYNNGKPIGRNGILVWKADGVSVDNLTTCNFLTGSSGGGNEIWWDGQPSEATTGRLGLVGYSGSYLTATSTYYDSSTNTGGAYGIFSSASSNGVWNNIYGSNFNDSGMYIGACRNACDAWVHDAWMEYNPLGYSGTNSGGTLVISDSQFDNNKDGFDTNSQIAGDPPPIQDGTCPDNGVSGLTGTHSCWVFMDNDVHDNNNPNVPGSGSGYAGAAPVGTGMTVSGARNDTVMNNTFASNGSWGALFLPFADSDSPPPGISCSGQGVTNLTGLVGSGPLCGYDAFGDALIGNTFSHNGFFSNPTNSDFGNLTLTTGIPQNCFSGNVMPDGSSPADLETTNAVCGPLTTSSNFSLTPGTLGGEVLCNTGLLGSGYCLPTDHYPRTSTVTPLPLPTNLPTMPNPCVGVPSNAWCRAGAPA